MSPHVKCDEQIIDLFLIESENMCVLLIKIALCLPVVDNLTLTKMSLQRQIMLRKHHCIHGI